VRFGQPLRALLQRRNNIYNEWIIACNAAEEIRLNYRNGNGGRERRKGGGRGEDSLYA